MATHLDSQICVHNFAHGTSSVWMKAGPVRNGSQTISQLGEEQ